MKMERTKVIELIQLYVTGCMNGEELQLIKSLMEDEENFPWIELAQYQNLIVLLPSVLPLELPDAQIKQQMVEKLNQLIYGESNEAKKTAQSQVKGEQKSKSKIDWASLSVTGPTISQTSGGNDEIKHSESHVEVIQETESQKSEDLSSDETFSFINDVINEEIKNKSKKFSLSWIYVLVPIIVIAVAVIFSVYNFLPETEEVPLTKEIIKSPVSEKTVDSINTEEDTLIVAANEIDTIKKVDTLKLASNIASNKETLQKILPTAPPKTPEMIEAPLIEETKSTEENNVIANNEMKLQKEESQPPKEEIVEKEEEPSYFIAVEEMPEPIGGLKAIQDKIVYPEIAKRVGVEGKVYVRAFVDETGNVTKAELVKGIGAGCDEIALDAVLNTAFKPGKQRGKTIKVQVTVPIVFKLR